MEVVKGEFKMANRGYYPPPFESVHRLSPFTNVSYGAKGGHFCSIRRLYVPRVFCPSPQIPSYADLKTSILLRLGTTFNYLSQKPQAAALSFPLFVFRLSSPSIDGRRLVLIPPHPFDGSFNHLLNASFVYLQYCNCRSH
jgi:hypothetical protein